MWNTETIETKRLALRKFTNDDLQDFYTFMSDADVNRYLPWFPLTSENEALDFLQNRFIDYYKKEKSFRYAICLKEDNKPIGYIWLSDDESNDFGYGLRREFWNTGIVTEGCKAVLKEIKKAGYSYVTATHDINNIASGEVMKKLGMEYKYSYIEQWQPKDISVTFRIYQLNFDNIDRCFMKYAKLYNNYFIEENL